MPVRIEKARPNYIDYAKVIGVYLVIFAHYLYYLNLPFEPNPLGLTAYLIELFHMPLFFIISGMLYRERPFKEIVKKCITQLLIPYVAISVICLMAGSVLTCIRGEMSLWFLLKNIIGIITGNDFFGCRMAYSGPLWFCYSLITIKLIMCLLQSLKHRKFATLLIIAWGGVIMYMGNSLPFRIDSSLVGFIFFSFGYYSRNLIARIQEMRVTSLLGIAILSAVILCFITLYDFDTSRGYATGMSIQAVRFGKISFLFLLSGVAGTMLVFVISRFLSVFKSKWVLLISNGAIIVLGFQQIFMLLFRGHILSQNLVCAMAFSFAILLLCVIIILLSNKYFPILSGNRSKS